MDNYCEYLWINQNASFTEIEAACDYLYDNARLNIISHDAIVRSDAESLITKVEEIRSILLDPNKKNSYDKEILGKNGGLADPTNQYISNSNKKYAQNINNLSLNISNAEKIRNSEVCPKCNNGCEADARHCPKCSF